LLTLIRWTAIYPIDSVIQPSKSADGYVLEGEELVFYKKKLEKKKKN